MSKNNMTKEDKKIIRSLFWRSLALEGSFNYEKMQALGFAWAMFPVIKKYHKTKEAQAEALQRHTAFFNISPPLVTFPLGIAATMERQYAEKGDIDPSSINAMKVSLMGPLSGIGDSLFWGTFRVIASGVGVALAQQANVLGPVLYMVMFTVPHILLRYFCTVWGYKFGSQFIQNAYESGLIAQVTKLCTVIGLTTVGAMISSMVTVKFGFQYTMGSMEFVLQDVFDQIMPGIVPLALTMGTFLLIRLHTISETCSQIENVIDFKDKYVLPGIVDIHNHGYFGWSAKTIDCEEIKGLSCILPSIGVTATLATTSAWKAEEFRMLEAIAQAIKEGCTGTKILGIHMEGPYFNPSKHNATALSEVQLPDVEKTKKYIEVSNGCLKYMTLAPEMDNGFVVMDYLKEHGIHIGCGHTEADYPTFEIAKLHGMETSIHTGNAMRQMDRREVALMGGALLDQDIYCEIICDGFHVTKEMLELMFRIKRDFSKFIMISDSDILSGMAPGTYYAFGKSIHVQEDGKILLDDGTINGSSKNILYGMKNLVENLHIPLSDVIKMCSLNPATLLQVQDDIGSIAEGKCADFIVLNHDFTIYETYISGVSKYRAGDEVNKNPKFSQICKRID